MTTATDRDDEAEDIERLGLTKGEPDAVPARPTFAERFEVAFVAAMRAENEELETLPKLYALGDCIEAVVDPDDGHFATTRAKPAGE